MGFPSALLEPHPSLLCLMMPALRAPLPRPAAGARPRPRAPAAGAIGCHPLSPRLPGPQKLAARPPGATPQPQPQCWGAQASPDPAALGGRACFQLRPPLPGAARAPVCSTVYPRRLCSCAPPPRTCTAPEHLQGAPPLIPTPHKPRPGARAAPGVSGQGPATQSEQPNPRARSSHCWARTCDPEAASIPRAAAAPRPPLPPYRALAAARAPATGARGPLRATTLFAACLHPQGGPSTVQGARPNRSEPPPPPRLPPAALSSSQRPQTARPPAARRAPRLLCTQHLRPWS
jgi:hypothetical protein